MYDELDNRGYNAEALRKQKDIEEENKGKAHAFDHDINHERHERHEKNV